MASLYGRNSLLEIIERTSRELFIPPTVAGGLRSIEDIQAVLQAGADKVCLNTAAVKDPELIRQAARRFGSSTIVVAIEAKRQPDGSYEAYTDNGRERTGVEVFTWAARVVELGAGEILLTSIDREGTGAGYDLDLTRSVAEAAPVPVIACGGAGSVAHVEEVIRQGRADAVSMASLLHYRTVEVIESAQDSAAEGNTEFLQHARSFSKVSAVSLPELKEALASASIPCRPGPELC